LPSLTDAFNYVIAVCNDPYIGYSIPERTTGTLGVNYVTYFDCSSLMSKAMTVGGYFSSNPWFNTDRQPGYMDRAGWIQVDKNGLWMPGDIVYFSKEWAGRDYGHTEMVYEGGTGKGKTMGAHGRSGRAFPDQVSIKTGWSYASDYQYLYRDPTGTAAAYKWHQSNSALDEYGDDMTANAYMVFSYFTDLGFTYAAIAGLLGNMQAESSINPGRWQDGHGPGYGLVQWDPASKYRNWATSVGIDMDDADQNGDGQCQYIDMCEDVGQWGSYGGYSYTWAQFAQLDSWREATLAFLYQFERPSTPHTENRLRYAEYWYDILSTGIWYGDGGNPSHNEFMKSMAFISDLQRRLVIPGRH